jgi:excisionase family DNA binding protein
VPRKDLDLITAAEAADLLELSIRTVHRMAEDGRLRAATKLPGTKGAWLFERTEVLRQRSEAS